MKKVYYKVGKMAGPRREGQNWWIHGNSDREIKRLAASTKQDKNPLIPWILRF